MSYPLKYQQQNTATTKKLNVVIEVEGLPFFFSLVTTYKKIRYGDPDIEYGAGYVYGQLIKRDDTYPYLDPNTALQISQKVEPEQGRGSASTMNFDFIDKDGFVTRAFSSGIYAPQMLGSKMLKVWVGYADTSFREDYFVVYRGYITQIISSPTKFRIQTTDAFYKMKQQTFLMPQMRVRPIAQEFNPSDVNTSTNFINFTTNNFQDGDIIEFTTTGSLPGGLTGGTEYYIKDADGTKFRVSLTENGSTVILSSQGTGVHTATLLSVGANTTYIPVYKTDGITNKIEGPDGNVDPALKTLIRIDDEIMEYDKDDFGSDFINVTRAQFGTRKDIHDVEAEVTNQVNIQENVIIASLKIMLSGWNGAWKEGVTILSFNETYDASLGVLPNTIVLPDNVDAVEDYGLATGDYLVVTGSTFNDATYTVDSFLDARGYPNNVINVNKVGGGNTTTENTTSGVLSIRSQYDTFPVNCGVKLKTIDVDTAKWQENHDVFVGQPDNTFSLMVKEPQSGKELVEREYLLPSGGYGITRFGKISSVYTKPPIASDNLQVLNLQTILDPENITITKALNTRKYWSDVQYFYDYDYLSDEYTTLTERISTDSIENFDTVQVLPIQARGLRSSLGADSFVERRGSYILRRYENAAIEIKIKTNWKTASLVQAGDTIALYDNGELKLSNLDTGERDLGFQLFEIIDWSLDIKSGQANLTLLSSPGYQITDRFATIAPSSVVGIGSSANSIKIVDSFGALYPNNEAKKWEPLVGDKIAVRNDDYSVYEEVLLIAVNPVDPTLLTVDTLSFTPSAGMIVDCAEYPTTTSTSDQARTKLLFVSLDPTLTVTSGTSTTVFDVSLGDAAQLNVGLPIFIRNDDWTIVSSESNVLSIVGTVVTLETPIEFTPSAGQSVELVGFKDGQGAYRIL